MKAAVERKLNLLKATYDINIEAQIHEGVYELFQGETVLAHNLSEGEAFAYLCGIHFIVKILYNKTDMQLSPAIKKDENNEEGNLKHPFRIGRLIKISRTCDVEEMDEYLSEIKYKIPVVDGADFPIWGDDQFKGCLEDWIDERIHQGQTGWFCIASTPVPEIVKVQPNCICYSWKHKYYNRFYAPTLEELEIIVQKWADEIYESVEKGLNCNLAE